MFTRILKIKTGEIKLRQLKSKKVTSITGSNEKVRATTAQVGRQAGMTSV